MALYTEKGLMNMVHKKAPGALRDTGFTGLYYEDPKKGKRYIVIGKQMGNPDTHTTNPERQERQLQRRKGWHPDSKKIEAATLHVALGNMAKVAELTKVPLGTLRRWADEDWWMTTQQRVKRESMEETDSKFSKLIDKAIDKLEKAVEKGDFIYDIKRGNVVNIPMTGRDLSIVAGTIFDKRQLIRGEATRITKTSDPEKHLEELARKFAELVHSSKRSNTYEGEAVEAEIIGPSELTDALQESSSEEVPIRQASEDSETVGEGISNNKSKEQY